MAEDWLTDTVPAGSDLIHFQANQTKQIDFKCKQHNENILGLLVGLGNRTPTTKDDPGEMISEIGKNKHFVVTDKDIKLNSWDRTPETLAWLQGKSMKEFTVQGSLSHFTGLKMV